MSAANPNHKFTLTWLLVEITLVAVICALARWLFLTELKYDSDREFLAKLMLGFPCLVAPCGAAVGAFFKRPWGGAIAAVVLLGLVLTLAITFGFAT